MKRITLEICVDDAAGLRAAVAGGADRIELCSALALGGLTPSAGLLALAAELPLSVMAMIRPRAGDFVWSTDDHRAMRAEIAAVRAAGLAGVVIGASHADGRLDEGALRDLVQAAQGLDITLHRAIDLVPDLEEAMACCRRLGIRRILSSGGAATAVQGIDRLAEMARIAPEISIMPGSGVTAENAALFASRLPLREIHASASSALAMPTLSQVATFGFQPPGAKGTDAAKVQAFRIALDRIAAEQT